MKAIKINGLLIAAAAWASLSGAPSSRAADSLFTTPVLQVSPRSIDFGSVPVKTTVTKSFVVENWGGGTLVGKATVPKPFKVVSGGSYRLGRSDAQVVTISYTPTSALQDTNVVKFTGGTGALAPVMGKPLSGLDLTTQK